MMIKTLSLKQKFILLGILPIGLCSLLMILALLYIQHRHAQHQLEDNYSLLSNVLDKGTDNQVSPETILEESAPQLLNIPAVQYFAFYDGKTNKLQHIGLPFKLKSSDWLDPRQATHKKHDQSLYIAFPYDDVNGPVWFIAGFNDAHSDLVLYGGLMCVLVVLILCAALAYVCQKSLYQSVLNPVSHVTQELNFVLAHDTEHPLNVSLGSPFADLVTKINELIARQHLIREEMQHHVAVATQELRETLETVEIQNIELDIARKNALQTSRIKSEFLANTSHELRTPLNGILGFTALLSKSQLSTEQHEHLGTIEDSAQKLLATINDILDFSKLETGDITLETAALDIHELVEQVLLSNTPAAQEKNIRLMTIVEPNVPTRLIGDAKRVGQVLHKLISNAVKFSNSGDVLVRVKKGKSSNDTIHLHFTVEDHGVGLSEAQLQNLFSAFTQADGSDSRHHGGTGLGLAIAKSLVNRMHGDIGVNSQQHKGSTFWFVLPFALDDVSSTATPLAHSLVGIHALLIGNDMASLELVAQTLNESDANLTVKKLKRNGEVPLDQSESQRPFDLIILDCVDKHCSNEAEFQKSIAKIHEQFLAPVLLLQSTQTSYSTAVFDEAIDFKMLESPITLKRLTTAIADLLDLDAYKQEHAEPSPLHTHEGVTVLAVDDNPANLKLLTEFLRGLGIDATQASNGPDAVEAALTEDFDLILMDVQMPGMSGMEATQRIRSAEKGKRTPIIALTAHIAPENKTHLLLSGMDDFMTKPISENDLQVLLERWVLIGDDHKKNVTSAKLSSSQSATPSAPTPRTTHTPRVVQPAIPRGFNSAQTSTPKVFDLHESLHLSKQLPDLAYEMLTMLLESFDEFKHDVESAYKKQDFEKLQEVIHRFHGGCCYCGVPLLRQASRSIEVALTEQRTDGLHKEITGLFAQMDALKAWLDDHDLKVLFGLE